jgi:hypothetical protein
VKWFQEIADALQAAGVKAILVGGHAVNHYGYGRLTMDVDLMREMRFLYECETRVGPSSSDQP